MIKLFIIILSFLLVYQFAEANNPPNIILIFTDDLGYADVGVFGAEGYETPHLDKMASEGIRFTDFYAMPVCSPSRASILTGSYPPRVGIPNVLGPEGPEWTKNLYHQGLNTEEETIAELLKKKNYKTACIGKWHLGHYEQFLPLQHGFDYYYGLPYSNDMWPNNKKEWPDLPLMEGNKVIELNPDQTQLTKRYTEKALSFIMENKDQPFFLYMAHSMPHVPIFASEKFKGSTTAGLYADVIAEIDWSAGEIIRNLKELGLDKNTLVIFTSDNGPWLSYGDHAGSAKPFREGKGTTFEGGVRVPSIFWWPGKIKAGKAINETASIIDVLPTVTEITGCLMPVKKIDGISLWPAITGKKSLLSDRVYYFYSGNELQAVRKGYWKLHVPHSYRSLQKPGSGGEAGTYVQKKTGVELYDLRNDPGETKNLADQHLDLVKKLQKYIQDFDAKLQQDKREPGSIL